ETSKLTVNKAKKAGIDVIVGSFILGAPDETREEMMNTIKFSQQIPIDVPQFNILGAHPGNDIWSEFVSKGYIHPENHWESGVAVCDVFPEAKVSKQEIFDLMQYGFFKRVYSPTFLVSQIAKTMKSSYRINTIVNNFSRINQIRNTIKTVA
ncbi:MAG: hypothetical protein R3250_12395, partial [Melioribacteraceae bacterium]|nr:hypothetical protein [Melioribacteraceae bacterium]